MQALAERRKLRSQSGGSSTEVLPAPEPPVVPTKDAKARVRFAVEEGEAPGDKPLDPEVIIALSLYLLLQERPAPQSSIVDMCNHSVVHVLDVHRAMVRTKNDLLHIRPALLHILQVVRVSPRSALKQTTQPSPRTSPRGSVQRTSPPSARPPAGMRSRGSQEQLTALMKADNIRRQLRVSNRLSGLGSEIVFWTWRRVHDLHGTAYTRAFFLYGAQDPVDAKRMTRIEKQFALMELQYLLGDHRASDRRQADALVRVTCSAVQLPGAQHVHALCLQSGPVRHPLVSDWDVPVAELLLM
jgi:hypothetical protein